MNRVHLRRALAVLTVVTIIAGTFTAQAAEPRIAGRITAPSTQTIPRHTCTPTLCYVTPPRHLSGGWPDPLLPALLLGAGLLGTAAWIRLSPSATATEAKAVQASRPSQKQPSTTVPTSSNAAVCKDAAALRRRFPRPRIGQL
jgi:hypothetical protein